MNPFSGGFEVFVMLVVVLALVALWTTVKMVPQGYNYTVETFGRYTRTLSPGLHILIPVMERIGAKMNMKEQVIDIPSQDIITKDNAMVTVDGVNFYQVLNAAKAAYEVDQLRGAIVNLTMTNIRTVMGSMDLDELLANRDQINARLLQVVDAATEPWGVKVTRIEIKDIAPPRDLVDSMARQMKAEREKRAQILEAEGLRQGAILKAEGEKQAVVLAAEGRKEAAFRDAEARERFAEAEAQAPRRWCRTPSAGGNVQAINYFVANNYVKALEAIAKSPNQKILMMPLEAASVIGSLAGLAEITSEAFGRRWQRRAGGRGAARARAACRRRKSPATARGHFGENTHAGLSALLYSLGPWNWFILAVVLLDPRDHDPGRAFPLVRSCRRCRRLPGAGHRRCLAVAGAGLRPDLGAHGVLGAQVRAARRGDQRSARPQRARTAIRRPLAGGGAGDPERTRQGACRRQHLGRRRPGCAGRRAGDRHRGQGHRARGGACNGLIRTRARSRGSWRSSVWCCRGLPPFSPCSAFGEVARGEWAGWWYVAAAGVLLIADILIDFVWAHPRS